MPFLNTLKHQVSAGSRATKMNEFLARFTEDQNVLDVGVSGESPKVAPSLNYFLKHFPYDLSHYTGLGVMDMTKVQKEYQDAKLVRYEGGEFPFEDKSFDWVFSNAVIEHVGDRQAQLQFIDEMVRVAKSVYFTTPNKFFPLESHSDACFLHWNDHLFYCWCSKYRPHLTRDNLLLLSGGNLTDLLRKSQAKTFDIRKNRVAGMTMTYSVFCSD